MDFKEKLAGLAGGLGVGGGGVDLGGRKSGEFLASGENNGRGVALFEDVLREGGLQGGEFRIERAELGFFGLGELGAGAYEIFVVALKEAHGLGVETERAAAVIERGQAGEKSGVEADGVAVRGELGREGALDLLHLGVGVGAGEVAEHGTDAAEEAAGAFERDDGVVERGRGGGARDGGDFGELCGHARLVGRQEMGVFDEVETRIVERQGALGEEWIGGRSVGGGKADGGAQQCSLSHVTKEGE